jgi:hypothetical protein
MKLTNGTTRSVILTRRWAIKIPCVVYGLKNFLFGLLANMQEVSWSGFEDRLCPVKFSLPYGFLVVMPLCKELTDEEFAAEVPWGNDIPLVENKSSSFGRLNGKIVAFDYGGCGKDGRTTKVRQFS